MSETTRQKRFVVVTKTMPSYLIFGYELTDTRLTLRTYVERDSKIMDRVQNARIAEKIEIRYLNDEGDVVENIVVNTPILLDWSVDASWSNDNPLELKLIYGFNKLD